MLFRDRKRILQYSVSSFTILALLLGAFVLFHGNASAASISGQIIPLSRIGSASLASAPAATDFSTQANEIDATVNGDDADGGSSDDVDTGSNRTLPGAVQGNGKSVNPNASPKSNPALGTNFDGLSLFDQRFANGGNQFSVEPPDQGLCAGNGFVVESVNDVLRMYHADGTPATGVIDLNTFYNYSAAIVRSGPNTGQEGPSITDPSCLYDQAINRFVEVVLTLDRVSLTNPALNGNNHLDIAVSDTADPTGSWSIFKIPVQDNGTEGTPDHHCLNGFCLGDYPHIGADANGIYLTTNEFNVFGPSHFYGAQVYAVGHNVLTSGSGNAVHFNTLGIGPDGAGFTVWPAQTPGSQFDTDNGGTEFFLSSDAVFFANGTSTSLLQWTLTNTSSLNSASPNPLLDVTSIGVEQYAAPPRATQPAGNRPLGTCIGDTVIFPTCNSAIAGRAPTNHNNATFGPPNGTLNSNDSRMQQVTYANGKLWGALDSAVNVGGQNRAGIAYYIINPNAHKVDLQGQAGIAHTDLTYPAIGVTESGRGVIAFTLTGDNNYPSAAFAGLDAKVGMGDVQIAKAGVGPWDGFTSYVTFGSGRPRWGDYGAAAVVGPDIWIASEDVAQTCTYATYIVDPTCGGTRAPLGNWATHISKVTP
ncbi:MAG TPA: hypothetical protein VF099_01460 [Ktedonobacterales bacterium]